MRLPFVIGGVVATGGIALACCMAFSASNPMSLVGEKALIVWDSDRQIQHFVRQASFEGEAMDFGFIVPTPTEPTVAEADAEVFVQLEQFVQWKLARPEPTGTDSAPEAAAGSVELVDQYMVGDYEVSILKATDGASMVEWLSDNNYDSRPAMEDWLDHYAKMGWYFAALKFVRPEDAQTPETSAVRVTFKTDVPFYPYKMPEDTWPEGHFRPIALYFVSNGVARGQYRDGGGDWEAREVWSGEFPRSLAEDLATQIGLTLDDIPEQATLTALMNSRNATGYDKDLYFLTYNSVLPTWVVLLVFGLAGVGIVWFFASRRRETIEKT